MKKILLLILLFCELSAIGQQTTVNRQYAPWVRWWWNGDKVDTTEIKRELHVLHQSGIGGVEINPIEFPAKRCDSLGITSLTWLSDEWLNALGVALHEAKSLGMGCDLLVGSGWPFGTENLPMEQRAQVMLTYVVPVNSGDTLSVANLFNAVDPKVTVPNPDRQFELISLKLTPDTIHALSQVLDLPLPVGDTFVLPRFTGTKMLYALVRCRSFASVINGAPGASGPILDHLNATAVRQYLENMSAVLERHFGPMKNWLRAYFVDSMELEGANWTDDFAAEFRRRRGYDLMPWLPFTMFKVGRLGDVVSYEYGACHAPEFKQQVQQARLDFELTKAELLDERYTQTFLQWCRKQGVKSRSQAYGRGFFPLESSLDYDIPEGESWTTNYLRHRVGEEMPDNDYRRGRAYTMINKYVSSAAHQSGHRLISAEEMTNTYRLFETTLELLKLGSDMSAAAGITHSVWHGFNYSPPEAGFPGWVQYGSYYNEQNSWWPYFHLLNEYRAHLSSILQNADMQTDIAILLPLDSLWARYGVQTEPFPNYPKGTPYHIPQLLWEAVHKNGGNCDLLTPWQLRQATIHNNCLAYRDKQYKALLIPTDSCIELRTFAADSLRITHLPLPDSNHYLEWYARIQHHYHLPHAVTIQHPDRFLLQNHYRDDTDNHIFLFVNAHLRQSVETPITFDPHVTQGRTPYLYDPGKDQWHTLPLNDNTAWLYFEPAQTMLVVFTTQPPDDLTPWYPSYNEGTHTIPLQTTWHLTLYHAIEGWTRDTTMTLLRDLRETSFANFSGTAIYTTHLYFDTAIHDTINGILYTPESIEGLMLGQICDICQLRVNGTDCGTQWYGNRTYRNLTGLLHPGDNTIEITVTTTLNNYVHTLTDNPVIQHFVLKRNVPTTPAGLLGYNGILYFF